MNVIIQSESVIEWEHTLYTVVQSTQYTQRECQRPYLLSISSSTRSEILFETKHLPRWYWKTVFQSFNNKLAKSLELSETLSAASNRGILFPHKCMWGFLDTIITKISRELNLLKNVSRRYVYCIYMPRCVLPKTQHTGISNWR